MYSSVILSACPSLYLGVHLILKPWWGSVHEVHWVAGKDDCRGAGLFEFNL